MEDHLIRLRQAIAEVVTEQRRVEQQYSQEQAEILKWQKRYNLALPTGKKYLVDEALRKKEIHEQAANIIQNTLDQLTIQVDSLKKGIITLESGISRREANDSIYALSAFERMEEKALQLEAQSQAYGELGSMGIEQEFAKLEAGSDVDDELALLKAEMSGGVLPRTAPDIFVPPQDEVVDAELEELRKKLKKM